MGYIHLNTAPIVMADMAKKIAGVVIFFGSLIIIKGLISLGDKTPTTNARVE